MAQAPRRTHEQRAAEYQRKANAARAKAAKQKRETETRLMVGLGEMLVRMANNGNFQLAGKDRWAALLVAVSYYADSDKAPWLEAEIRRRMEAEEQAAMKA